MPDCSFGNISEKQGEKNIRENKRREIYIYKRVRTAERNFNVSRNERKKTITTDSDDRSGTSE